MASCDGASNVSQTLGDGGGGRGGVSGSGGLGGGGGGGRGYSGGDAVAVHSGGGAAGAVAVSAAVSLAGARVVAGRWGGGDGDFHVVAGSTWLVLAARGGARDREAWVWAINAAIAAATPTPAPAQMVAQTMSAWGAHTLAVRSTGGGGIGGSTVGKGTHQRPGSAPTPPSAGLGQETRAALAVLTRMASAFEAADGARHADQDANDEAAEEEESGGGGVTAHFLFNFTVEAIRRENRDEAEEGKTSSLLLHVDVERRVIEAYALRRRGGPGGGGIGGRA